MTAHRINSHLRIGRVHELQNSQPLLLDQIRGLSFEFVIRQSSALDFNPLVPCPEIAVNTLLLADACHVDGNNHKNSSTIKRGSDFSRTGDDGMLHLASLPKSFAPKERRE